MYVRTYVLVCVCVCVCVCVYAMAYELTSAIFSNLAKCVLCLHGV